MAMRFWVFAATTATLAAPALAHDYALGALTIDHPVAYETAATAMTGAGYMAISNAGPETDRLIAIRADFAKVMLHESREADGIASMVHVETVEVPAGATVTFAPGGYHVMFMGLSGDPFEIGEQIPATLVFEKAGEVDVVFNVEARAGDADMQPMDHSGHDMPEAGAED